MFDLAKRFCLGAGIGAFGHFPNEQIANLWQGRVFSTSVDFSKIDFVVKIKCLCIGILFAPVYEEVLYRSTLQGVMLKQMFKNISPSRLASGLPIFFSSILFALPHPHQEYAFLCGIELGIIKESKLRLAGSIGAHMANNCLSLRSILNHGETR